MAGLAGRLLARALVQVAERDLLQRRHLLGASRSSWLGTGRIDQLRSCQTTILGSGRVTRKLTFIHLFDLGDDLVLLEGDFVLQLDSLRDKAYVLIGLESAIFTT